MLYEAGGTALGMEREQGPPSEELASAHHDSCGRLTLSLAAVMPERAKIVSQLGAAEPVEISPGINQVSRGEAYRTPRTTDELAPLRAERDALAAEVVRLEEVIRSLLAADAALYRAKTPYRLVTWCFVASL